jgi:hypothetical protein
MHYACRRNKIRLRTIKLFFLFVYLTTLVTTKVLSVGRSQFNVHTDKRTQVCGARSFLAVTHPIKLYNSDIIAKALYKASRKFYMKKRRQKLSK